MTKPGRAEAAHEAVVVDERFLDGVELPVLLEPLDGADRPALRLDREHRAGVAGPPSMITVHAPQEARSQTRFEPVRSTKPARPAWR